jgi:hypothetical protein
MPIIAVREATMRSQARLEAAGERVSFDGSDDRFGRRLCHDPEPAAPPGRSHVPSGRGDEVLAGGEDDVGAGQNGAAQFLVVLVGVDGRLHRARGGAIERVAPMWPVDADDQQMIARALGADGACAGGVTG